MPLFTICLVVISKKFFIPQKTAWHYIKEGYMAHNFQKVILIRGCPIFWAVNDASLTIMMVFIMQIYKSHFLKFKFCKMWIYKFTKFLFKNSQNLIYEFVDEQPQYHFLGATKWYSLYQKLCYLSHRKVPSEPFSGLKIILYASVKQCIETPSFSPVFLWFLVVPLQFSQFTLMLHPEILSFSGSLELRSSFTRKNQDFRVKHQGELRKL